MQVISGVLYHFIGGFASGSFYVPYKKVSGWSWETYWIVGGLFSWLIIPPLAAFLTIPGFAEIIANTPTGTIALAYAFGVLWGIGGLTYGLGVRYLGVSLGSSIMLGLCSIVGALIPSFYYDLYPKAGKDSFTDILASDWGKWVLLGTLVCVVGIILCGLAGANKEKDLAKTRAAGAKTEFKLALGLSVAIVSGVLSACFNFGLEAGKPMADTANAAWKALHPGQGEFLFQNNVTYVVVLWGGLTTNFLWCMLLNARNKTFGDYLNKKTPLANNYLFSALAGITWFLQFFFYGMGESRMGNGPSSWILHMAFIILFANLWGLLLKEWKGVSKKTSATIIAGILTIILSVLIVGYGNSLK